MAVRPRRPPIKAEVGKYAGCLTCELRCSLRFEQALNPLRGAIQVRRLVGTGPQFSISFTEKCDNCGLCVRFCPYGALR